MKTGNLSDAIDLLYSARKIIQSVWGGNDRAANEIYSAILTIEMDER